MSARHTTGPPPGHGLVFILRGKSPDSTLHSRTPQTHVWGEAGLCIVAPPRHMLGGRRGTVTCALTPQHNNNGPRTRQHAPRSTVQVLAHSPRPPAGVGHMSFGGISPRGLRTPPRVSGRDYWRGWGGGALYIFACMGLPLPFRWSFTICHIPAFMRPLRCGHSGYVMRRVLAGMGVCLPPGVA